MSTLLNLLLLVQILSALGMIGLILVQHGKGADMGAAFGSGNSGSLFGASGGANFLSRTTAVLAAVFFVCTLVLAYFGNLRPTDSGSLLERTSLPVTAPPSAGDNIPGSTSAPVSADAPATADKAVPSAPATTPASTPASQIPAK
ncbi:MAG: preprotein translocase subunit SecG [Betaproteobacteria bacterium]|jgi:preprotein translocase subunit SecG|nr:preprotein translocase subunit SecG [Betaproteobacteria bacterium]